MANNKIGILGSGQVSKSLAGGFLRHGYDVMVGSRDITKLKEWQHDLKALKFGPFEQTAGSAT